MFGTHGLTIYDGHVWNYKGIATKSGIKCNQGGKSIHFHINEDKKKDEIRCYNSIKCSFSVIRPSESQTIAKGFDSKITTYDN